MVSGRSARRTTPEVSPLRQRGATGGNHRLLHRRQVDHPTGRLESRLLISNHATHEVVARLVRDGPPCCPGTARGKAKQFDALSSSKTKRLTVGVIAGIAPGLDRAAVRFQLSVP